MDNRLISVVDLAPTLLSIAGAYLPKNLQREIFAGSAETAPRKYGSAARDRMDEVADQPRTVRDERYKNIMVKTHKQALFTRIIGIWRWAADLVHCRD
jgi:arylsulfatase A-like enzyme